MNGKRRFVSKIMIMLIPSNPSEKLIPRKLIQSKAYEVAEGDKTKDKVIIRLITAAASAIGRTTDALRNGSRHRPVSIGRIRMISSIMGSDCQDKYDK